MYDLTEIKKISIIDYLNSNGIMIKDGGRTRSPLRAGAKNPTSFYATKDYFYDFGSGEGGDIIDLVRLLKYKGDTGSAIRELAKSIGLADNNSDMYADEIQQLCNRAAYYHEQLTPSDYEYLYNRGLTDKNIHDLMIGRVTDGYLKGRLFLPYFKNGAVVYYATRSMPDGAFQDNKYMKASKDESQAYQHIPWGYHTLNRGNDMLVISEGYFDAVSWDVSGYSVLSAITGNFSKQQIPALLAMCRAFKQVLIIFDNDKVSHAGEGFTNRLANTFLQNNIPFIVGHTPQNIKDVNDYYASGGDLSKIVDTAIDGLIYLAHLQKNTEELTDFLMKINRIVSRTKIAEILDSFIDELPKYTLTSLRKMTDSAPSESLIADEIIKKHNLIYVDNIGFYEYDGKIWKKIADSQVRNYADRTYGKRFATAQRTGAVTNLLKRRSLSTPVFDRNPVLTFQNGTLEINTGKFREFSPLDYCSIIMTYNYDPERKSPLWENFIATVTHEDEIRKELLQFIRGYTLFPDNRFQKIFALVGAGGNGKSVYLEIIQKLFGDSNVTHIEPNGLTQEFQRIRLKDSLLNIGADISSDFSKGEIREWLLKIADGTSIQACYKGMTHVDFVPRCKLIYATNVVPTADVVNGLNRRLQFIEFPCRFTDNPDPANPYEKQRDVNLIPKLLTQLPAIFNWAYDGYKQLLKYGEFTDAPEQTRYMEQFELQSNPIIEFCDDNDDRFTGEVQRDSIYQWYVQWCSESGHKPMSRVRFTPKFREVMGDRILDEHQSRVNGVRLRFFVFDL